MARSRSRYKNILRTTTKDLTKAIRRETHAVGTSQQREERRPLEELAAKYDRFGLGRTLRRRAT
jgi:predicted kinase